MQEIGHTCGKCSLLYSTVAEMTKQQDRASIFLTFEAKAETGCQAPYISPETDPTSWTFPARWPLARQGFGFQLSSIHKPGEKRSN
jgi:hypothetical protein